jgi:hypothetical protein
MEIEELSDAGAAVEAVRDGAKGELGPQPES